MCGSPLLSRGEWKGFVCVREREVAVGPSKNGVGRWIERLVGVEEQQLLWLLIDLSFF